MYTIGEFALIAELSTKTLRHYDEVGLFKPFKIDALNNYRYYSKEQINEIMFIKELKNYGLSLNDINHIKESGNKEFLNSILENQLLIVEEKIIRLQEMKKSINEKINESSLWNNISDNSEYSIDIVNMEASEVIFIRRKIRLEQVGQLIGELYEIASKFSVKLKGSHMISIHNRDEEEFVDVEVFAPIEESESLDKAYKNRFEGGEFLKTTHYGLSSKGNAYAKLYDYARQNNYKLNELAIENYKMNSGKLLIDIMFRIEE